MDSSGAGAQSLSPEDAQEDRKTFIVSRTGILDWPPRSRAASFLNRQSAAGD